MKVAVVIPTLNEGATIGSLLDSLNSNTYKRKEIIIVDGGSTDNTVEIAKGRGATVIEEAGDKTQRCPANARNQGAQYSDAGLIAFLDADSRSVNGKFLENAVNGFKKSTAAAYAGYRTVQSTTIEKIVSNREGISIHPTFVSKDVFIAVGGYPPIGYGEDHIFDKRVRQYAEDNLMEVISIPESFWTGYAVRTVRELYVQHRWYGRTLPLYVKSLDRSVKMESAAALFKPVYFLLFMSVFLLGIHQFFIFPSLMFLVLALATAAKNSSWGRAKLITNLIAGAAVVHGLIIYIISSHSSKGR